MDISIGRRPGTRWKRPFPSSNEDEWVNLREAEALARCGRPKGMAAVIRMAADADAGLIRAEALKKAIAFAGRPAKSVEGAEGEAALADLSAW